MAETLRDHAVRVLSAAQPAAKVALSRRAAALWRKGELPEIGTACPPPLWPARPERPVLLSPRDMPKRRRGSASGRIALLHAVAHIEFNAIDLAWDLLARFVDDSTPKDFIDDWLGVAAEEAEHFEMVAGRLEALGSRYGDLPAHAGLWDAAVATADDVLARLAVVPLVLEARGLDVTPAMITQLEDAGDAASAAVLRRIYRDEIGHVAAGARWFDAFARRRKLDPETAWRDLVNERFRGPLKPPFNREARAAAGLTPCYYEPLAAAPR